MEKAKLPSDPKDYGKGIWIVSHMMAKRATTEEAKKEFINYMYMLYDNFPCGNCRNHIQEYMNTHPFEPFLNLTDSKGREIGLFKWLWMFHNTVNKRLQKPYLDWETACEMYNIEEENIQPCTHCGSSEEKYIQSNTSLDKNKIVQGYFLKKGIPETLSKSQIYF